MSEVSRSRSCSANRCPATHFLRPLFAGILGIALLAGFPHPSHALDGRLDVRSTYQEGRAGESAYRTNTRREEGIVRQRLTTSPTLSLDLSFRVLRELTDSRAQGIDSDFRVVTYQPGFFLSHRNRGLRLGASGNGYRREFTGSGTPGPSLDRVDYGWWASLRPWDLTTASVRWKETDSWREEEPLPTEEVRERVLSFDALQRLPKFGRLRYLYSRLDNTGVSRDRRTIHETHTVGYDTDARFFRNRANVNLSGRSQFFFQTVRTDVDSTGALYQTPLVGGFLLDDTPEMLDPLEGELTQVPALFDRDRSTPTAIGIGDRESAVREFGGDYRNIQFDFGEEVAIDSVYLYIDRTILNPQFYQWRVFTTNDPEGRVWEELSPSDFQSDYREWSTGLQGWEFVFPEEPSVRFFKLVDVKLGEADPDLFVTELEVYSRGEVRVSEKKDETQTHRFEGGISYRITSGLHVRYDILYRERNFAEEYRNLVERGHGLTAGMEVWGLFLSANHQLHLLTNPTKQNTDVTSSRLSLGRGRGTRFTTMVSWARVADRSGGIDKDTDTYALSVNWQIAPALRFDQMVTHGRLSDRGLSLESRSYGLVTGLRARPFRRLSVDAQRTDRWVDQEGGTGFDRFNNTSVSVGWSPTTQISVRSELRYQVRDESDWVFQNLLSWQPAPGGDLQTRFTLNHFQDSRNDTSQKGAGMSVIWHVQPKLLVEGDLRLQEFVDAGEKNKPLGGGFRVALTF